MSTTDIKKLSCPLCGSIQIRIYTEDRSREYAVCDICSLVFVPEKYHVTLEQEKARYDLHQNVPDDSGYRAFLSRLFDPMCKYLPKGSAGLDFGCGPGPALVAMFRESGYSIDIYDPFYAPYSDVFEKRYDFITATEVLEHLRCPAFELPRLFDRLKAFGILGVMTKLVKNREAFEKWHYKNDDTHICFFSRETFEWLGDMWQVRVEFFGNDVILIHKPEFSGGGKDWAIGTSF